MGQPVNFILSGYGKMGRLIEKRASERGHGVIAVIDPVIEKTERGAPVFRSLDGLEKQDGETEGSVIGIDFTTPDAAERNIRAFAERRIPLVIGTTGWYGKLDEISAFVESRGSSMLWASNFSLGVNLFYHIAAYCARLIDSCPEYDVAGYEIHHNQKADSPSGTAKTITDIVLRNMKRKTKAVWDKLEGPPEACEIHFASLRSGAELGVHALLFDSAADSIEIKHTARSRAGLVSGAVFAAEWLGKTTQAGIRGIFTINDILG
jgi:4-hydroxy-tetrahydrodipicolinate reductase